MSESALTSEPSKPPQWKPIAALDRRVAGVLVEKAKTTPEQYPLSLNALVNGCNQKNNRDPQMQVVPEDVEEALERLRAVGAIVEVQGGGRVAKYRHMMYEWLGLGKVELAVMAELLLRGAQTEGELRGRAARMDAIADLAALRPILDSLRAKGLVVSLTPEGRGHVVTHALYLPEEMEELRARFAAGDSGQRPEARDVSHAVYGVSSEPEGVGVPAPVGRRRAAPEVGSRESGVGQAAAPSHEIQSLRVEMNQLREELQELAERMQRTEDELRQMRDPLEG
jgi:uncharacterized protein YceH (UPF0502 family)